MLLSALAIAIEFEGGIHTLNRKRDAHRRTFLEAQGLTVIVLQDTDSVAADSAIPRASRTDVGALLKNSDRVLELPAKKSRKPAGAEEPPSAAPLPAVALCRDWLLSPEFIRPNLRRA